MLKSFTIAEVLITLGICGIIAAMTLPGVMEGYRKKQFAAQLKAAYTSLFQAIIRAEDTFGELKYWDFTDSNTILLEYIGTHLNSEKHISTTYYDQTHSMCDKMKTFNRYKFLSGTGAGDPFQAEAPSIQLPSGACIGLNRTYNTSTLSTILFIDLNGPQQSPNTFGKDLFMFVLTKADGRKILPYGYNDSTENATSANNMHGCNKASRFGGRECTKIIMENGWEFPKDYPW